MRPIAETHPVLTPTPIAAPSGPQWNARKHGMRSKVVLQPGEDAQEFHELRLEFYELYRPRTRSEARCVEAMAGYEWAMERCRGNREHHAGQLHALLHGHADGTPAPHCDTDSHRYQHKGMDCTIEERRLSWLQEREKRKLFEWQELRRRNLVADAKEEAARLEARQGPVLHPAPLVEAAEVEAPAPPSAPAAAPSAPAAPPRPLGSTPCPDWGLETYCERETAGAAPPPAGNGAAFTACSSAANFP